MQSVYAQNNENTPVVDLLTSEDVTITVNGETPEGTVVTTPAVVAEPETVATPAVIEETETVVEVETPTVTETREVATPSSVPEAPQSWIAENALSLALWGAVVLALLAFLVKRKGKVLGFLQERVGELENVTFPTQNQAVHSMILVLVIMLLTGLMLGGMDALLNWFVFDVLR